MVNKTQKANTLETKSLPLLQIISKNMGTLSELLKNANRFIGQKSEVKILHGKETDKNYHRGNNVRHKPIEAVRRIKEKRYNENV